MRQIFTAALGAALVAFAVGCPGDAGHGHDHGPGADHDHAGGDDHHADDEGHGHDHDAGGSDGVVAQVLQGEEKVGWLRLKLHDDKGDLELWLARDGEFAEPFDLPLDQTITVTFTDKESRTAELAARNREQNEDEDGTPTARDGKTNYFIFPGDRGADASWLKGADFLATVKVSFAADGKDYTTSQFVLRPHTHGAGEHAH